MWEILPCGICDKTSVCKPLDALRPIKGVYGKEMLQYCINVQILEPFTLCLCQKCCTKLKMLYKFKLLAEKSLYKNMGQIILESVEKTESEDKISWDFSEIKLEEDAKEIITKNDITNECKSNDEPEIKDEYFFKEEDVFQNYSHDVEDQVGIEVDSISAVSESAFSTQIEPNEFIENERDLYTSTTKENSQKKAKKSKENSPKKAKKSKKSDEKASSLQEDTFSCDKCNKKFKHKKYRNKHMKRVHSLVREWCDVCQKGLKNINKHNKLKHRPLTTQYQCETCGICCNSKVALRNHKVTHSEPTHKCPLCTTAFKFPATLNRHMKQVHVKERPFICDYCSKGFFCKYNLSAHIKRHSGKREHGCHICSKKLSSSHDLAIHIQRHSNLKPHCCEDCGATFVTISGLKSHMVTHTKEKKYACKICGVLFGRSDHRNRHERTAHKHRRALARQASIAIGKHGSAER